MREKQGKKVGKKKKVGRGKKNGLLHVTKRKCMNFFS